MSDFIKVADQIWEINVPAQKALRRSKTGLNLEDEELKSVPSYGIEDYIASLGYLHFKYIRDTKLIFSKHPICNYIERNARNDNPDAYLVCEKIASTKTYQGFRCAEHTNS
jgi:hypothetical protein